jgi:hypothetical protein
MHQRRWAVRVSAEPLGSMKRKGNVRRIGGALLATLGAATVVMFGWALLDPSGAQHSNDADPFGPPPITSWTVGLLCGVGLIVVGAWLMRLPRGER